MRDFPHSKAQADAARIYVSSDSAQSPLPPSLRSSQLVIAHSRHAKCRPRSQTRPIQRGRWCRQRASRFKCSTQQFWPVNTDEEALPETAEVEVRGLAERDGVRMGIGQPGNLFGLSLSLYDLPIPEQRAAPSYVPSYSSRIMVPSITQLLLKKLALSLDWGPNLSAWNRFIFGTKYLPTLKQAKNSIKAV